MQPTRLGNKWTAKDTYDNDKISGTQTIARHVIILQQKIYRFSIEYFVV